MVTSAEDACARAEKIGFTIMVKASEGGRMGFQFCYSMMFLLMMIMMTTMMVVMIAYNDDFQYV